MPAYSRVTRAAPILTNIHSSCHMDAGYYMKVFPLCFHYLIFHHTLVFFTCLFLFELPYMHSLFKLLTPSFCCIKPHVHYYQFMFWYTFFIWNDFDITNHCFVLLSHSNIINHTFDRTGCICHQLGWLLRNFSPSANSKILDLSAFLSRYPKPSCVPS